MVVRKGSCLCGSVEYEVSGEPVRVGLCHCGDCRKSSGSLFVAFAIWPRAAFSHSGEINTYAGRSFCPACGSRLFCLSEEEAEIRVGSLDMAPTDLIPSYEIWVKRREPWMLTLPWASQHEEDHQPRF